MFFDDRLATVLRQSADNELGQRTQYRQLLDILGNRKYGNDHSLIAAAWLRMSALAQELPSPDRAAMIREPGWRFRNADLAAHLADHEPEVASAALNWAQLSAEDWSVLIPRLPVRARGFLRLREDLPIDVEDLLNQLGVYDRGLPSPSSVANFAEHIESVAAGETAASIKEDGAADDSAFASDYSQDAASEDSAERPYGESAERPRGESDAVEAERSEISALVERIAQFRRNRDVTAADAERSPRLPFGDNGFPDERKARSFGFSADAGGRIEWADPDVAAMVIGTRLVATPQMGMAEHESPFERAFVRRQPISSMTKSLAGAEAIAGDWIIDAQPRFTDDGNFSGYLGRFRRIPEPDKDALTPAQREADRIRQLLHELRTPVTAVQGYAEVIQQQLFGPAPHEYRALAAVIAADAAHILAGFEELDRLARLETGAMETEIGETDIAGLAHRTAEQLSQVLSTRMAGFELSQPDDGPLMVTLDIDDAEALMWRFMATLAGGCGAGEVLAADIQARSGMIELKCGLPALLAGEEDIFAAEAKPIGSAINAGLFGAGFALRLARAEAKSAGGNLVRDNGTVTLSVPMIDGDKTLQTQA